MSNTQIVNARIVNEGKITDGDLLIEGDRIGGINVPANNVQTTIDLEGAWLLPGMIDDQVHFREPGLEHKADIGTESRAAVAGGITSYMEMPNCNPQTINETQLLFKRDLAASKSFANFAFYLGATNDNLEDIKSVDQSLTCGVKIFMGASTGNMLVDDPKILEAIFSTTPLLIATHCEDTPMIAANEQAAKERWGEDIPFSEHPNIRSEAACWASSSMAVELAKRFGSKLHVLHLTTAKELALFTAGPIEDKQITAEACVHHLFFDADDYETKGADIKCNPAIKTRADKLAIQDAVNKDVIDIIATDHAPHTIEEKARKYLAAPAGLPLVQEALLTLFDRVADNTFSIERVVHKTSHAPAIRYQVQERGFIREGYYADLVAIGAPGKGSPGVLSKCGWTPFAGHQFSHEVHHTWVNGRLAYSEGALIEGALGKPLTFNRG